MLAAVEFGKYGLCFSSGLGAGCILTQLLKAGDNIIASADVYGGVYRMFNQVLREHDIDVTFADLVDPEKLKDLIKPTTKIVWVETPSNPLMKIYDVERLAQIAHEHEGVILIVDNTFLSPYFMKPLQFGADVVMHSLTKYVNGHSDVIMGAIVTDNEVIYEKLKFFQNALGVIPSPFDCYLVNRSIKTLSIRMQQHMKNSIVVAEFLEKHPLVLRVVHPGLKSHPQHDIAKRQTSGWSGMLSFYIKGDLKESVLLINSLEIFTLAESLGGFESLIEIPSIMTHASVPLEEKKILGLTDNLIRISVGLESVEDLIEDFRKGFEKVAESLKANGPVKVDHATTELVVNSCTLTTSL